jgi:hypothetical protein
MRHPKNIRCKIAWFVFLVLAKAVATAFCQKPNPLDCNAIIIRCSLSPGESLQKKIGRLTFNIKAYSMDKNFSGWEFTLTSQLQNLEEACRSLPLVAAKPLECGGLTPLIISFGWMVTG